LYSSPPLCNWSPSTFGWSRCQILAFSCSSFFSPVSGLSRAGTQSRILEPLFPPLSVGFFLDYSLKLEVFFSALVPPFRSIFPDPQQSSVPTPPSPPRLYKKKMVAFPGSIYGFPEGVPSLFVLGFPGDLSFPRQCRLWYFVPF